MRRLRFAVSLLVLSLAGAAVAPSMALAAGGCPPDLYGQGYTCAFTGMTDGGCGCQYDCYGYEGEPYSVQWFNVGCPE